MTIRVLLVEDEEAIRKFTKINLEQAGYAILEAETGEKGVEIALEQKPEIVVLDLMLPGMSGYDVCEILRTKLPKIGIIMLTAKTQEIDRILGLEKGTDDYMVKPFNPKELVLRIKSLARRLNLEPDAQDAEKKEVRQIKNGPFVMDLYARAFYKNGKEIDLTPTELAIVKIFMQNAGRAFTRDEIMDMAWGEDYTGDTKIVDVNIRRIRSKVEDNPAKPAYLETVWGVGYRWKKMQP